MVWVDSAISVYFFPRNRIPADITADKPNPDSWPAPLAHWGDPDCNPATYFHDHFAIFDLTFCGDWAGNSECDSSILILALYSKALFLAWGGCAASTGVGSCQEYVQTRGGDFSEACTYSPRFPRAPILMLFLDWKVKYVKWYHLQ